MCGYFFIHSFECIGQNVYTSKAIYYNMDTTRCVENTAGFLEGDKKKSLSGNSDSAGSYCVFKRNINLPIVTVNDDNIIQLLDTCIFNAIKDDHLQFPDSSGFFVELLLFEKNDDSLSFGVQATPISNYYMAEILSSWRNDVIYEWYGNEEKELQGCFFLNDILCVVTNYAWFNYERASCLFSITHSTLRLSLFSPIITIVSGKRRDWYKCECYFIDCGSSHKPVD